jgi:tripartite-type tricarboxylate transporter receptor subunit TctC
MWIGLILGLCVAGAAHAAESYPARPIRVVIPFAAGGGIDVIGRLVSLQLAEQLGQQIVIDNRSGASGNIGGELVAKANPDGHTVLFALDNVLTINPHVFKLGYDPLRDLAPVSLVGVSQLAILVLPTGPARSLADFVQLVKEKPGQLTLGNVGTATPTHLAAEQLARMAGLTVTHVPYKGAPAAINDLLGGHINALIVTVPGAMAMIRANRVRALAVTGAKRSAILPELPTVAETGLSGYEAEFWVAFLAPAKTPPAIVSRLEAEIRNALAVGTVRASLLKQGVDAAASSPAALAELIARDSRRWGQLITDARIKISD